MTTSSKMKALVLREGGEAPRQGGGSLGAHIAIADIDVPQPTGSQVLIKVKLASVNPSDVIFAAGHQGQARIKGRPAGTEGLGEVVAAGDDPSAQALIGKRVSFFASPNLSGAWAEFAVAEAAFCIPLRDSIKDTDGAALIVNPLTALAMLDIVRQAATPAFILAAGASQISKFLISAAREENFQPTAVVRLHYQIPRLKAAGAIHVLNTQAHDYTQVLQKIIADQAPKVLLDAITGPLSSDIFSAMPAESRWVIYGQLDYSITTINDPAQLILQGKRIEGFFIPSWYRSSPVRRLELASHVQQRFSDGRWSTDVTAVVPLAEAIDRLSEELIKPDGKVFLAP